MKKLSIAVAALGFAAAALPSAASAQAWQGHNNAPGWQNINDRQSNLYDRIDRGVRSGQLNRREADRLRAEYRGLVNLEARYRRGGLSQWERNDLGRRYDQLSMRVRFDRNDRDDRDHGPDRGDHGPDRGPGRDGRN